MRDPNRIEKNWKKLSELHSKFPDWRMGQFILNLIGDFKVDPFFPEDDEFLKISEEIVETWKENIGNNKDEN